MFTYALHIILDNAIYKLVNLQIIRRAPCSSVGKVFCPIHLMVDGSNL
jgi:hypothetical protein